MKTKIFIVFSLLLTMSASLFAQSADNEDEVVKIDKWNQNAYRPNEVIVHFKEDGKVQMRAPQRAKFKSAAVNAVDKLFETLGVDSVEELMPMTGKKQLPRRMRAYNGQEIEIKPLGKLYRLCLSPKKEQNVYEVIEKLQELDEVDYAEPNYLVYTMALPYDDSIPTMDLPIYSQEPLYSQQWGLQAINLPALWDKPKKSSKRPVIAILDTGVDIEHPDLAANIWTNAAEAAGISGQDDDANGFKDDIHGWDFINNHSVTNDFNGHGTHCAGIAAAVGNNGIGITGANPDALIMPVTVMQSNGTGDVATIVKGIDYASANGADVISMSIGGYQYSMAEEQALGRAYADAVLVAAAGNNATPISKGLMFPAAFTFVLGVEASFDSTGLLAGFSNYDGDGPIYSSFGENELYNYELRAPGVQIMSTFPGGRYKYLNGTSMACPLVAGAISRLIQCKETLSWELLFGDLIHTRVVGGLGNVDFLAAYNIKDSDRHPELALVTANLTDTASGDGDNRADAGETIEFYPIFKNAWGQAENVRFWIKAGFDNQGDWVWDDTTLIHSLQDTAYFGKPLSSYAKATSLNPFRMTVSPDCADGRKINMTFFAICDNAADTLRQTITLDVENGVEIGGMISEDLTLYPNVHYIVTNNLAVPAGITLTIKPGTILKFKDGTGLSLASQGYINAIGTSDSMIVFTKADGAQGKISGFSFNYEYYGNKDTIHYVIFENMTSSSAFQLMAMSNCIIRNVVFNTGLYSAFSDCYIEQSNFIESSVSRSNDIGGINCNIVNIRNHWSKNQCGGALVTGLDAVKNCNVFDGINSSGGYISLYSESSSPIIHHTDYPSYWGSGREDIVRQWVFDIENGTHFGKFDLSNMLTRPSAEAHGIVWKILVDGIDAQDEFEQLPPIGVGTHKCEVYFNRPMDVSIAPTVSFGVRQPYTQHQVAENGSWSADSTIYTAYFTIDGKSVTDGLNTFKVYGAEDNEHFEIPEEHFRFRMEVAAAGSMATGLMAEAGLGKVTLTWETDEEDFADLLGYNIYRWTTDTIWNKNKTEFHFDTLCINSALIDALDTAYIDYNVVPGKAYYYVIRQMTTSLNNYDLSNPVTATPLTAQKGDSNGSMSVNVADVLTTVAYIMHDDPQPFIFEAADVNNDNTINIFDVVGTVNLILNPQGAGISSVNDPAYYSVEDGILYVETDAVLGGVQVILTADAQCDIEALEALDGFERVGQWQNENQYLFMAYTMSQKTIEPGKHALLRIGDAELESIVLSDPLGKEIAVMRKTPTSVTTVETMQISTAYPNPFTTELTIPYVIGENGKQRAQVVVTDVTGRTIDRMSVSASYGAHTLTWKPLILNSGIYFINLYVDDVLIQTEKVVKK